MYKKNYHLWLGAFFIFLFDLLTKTWALMKLPLESEVITRSWFSLNRVYNETTIFLNYDASSINMSPIEFRIFYSVIASILLIGTIWVVNQPSMNDGSKESEWAKTGLFIIIGGMFGNLFDRIFRQGVVDFIKLDFMEDSMPVINVADVMIYVGELCLLYVWLLIITKLLLKLKFKIII